MFHMSLRRTHVLLLLGEGMSKWQLHFTHEEAEAQKG